MNTKKILAVAAVVLMAVPAYAAASQIVLPGLREQVVEGHTVFAVIEKAVRTDVQIEAAAVAVLVREYNAVRERFNGVLWFNDQFLVAPYDVERNNVRYPCGGAVLAVNAGDPDPRTLLISKDDAGTGTTLGDKVARLSSVTGPQHDVIQVIQDSGGDNYDLQAGPAAGGSWLDVDVDGGRVTSTATAGVYDYEESYFITDPNDHTWIVDKYTGITTVGVDIATGAPLPDATTTFPLWAVNILGKPVFTPDDGGRSCPPFVDDPFFQSYITNNYIAGNAAVCGTTTGTDPVGTIAPDSCPASGPGLGADPNGDSVPADGWDLRNPNIGYYEPTDPANNGGASYCYDGNVPQGTNVGRAPGSGCTHTASQNKLRYYNAVLYFYLGPDDVRRSLTEFKDHTGPLSANAADTNGCESTPAYIDGTPKLATEWACPAGNDDAEGNSHPFNPPGVYIPAVFDPTTGTQIPGTGTVVDVHCPSTLACNRAGWAHDYLHDTGRVDLYFSGTARPMEPPVRSFETFDIDGHTDPFHVQEPATTHP